MGHSLQNVGGKSKQVNKQKKQNKSTVTVHYNVIPFWEFYFNEQISKYV